MLAATAVTTSRSPSASRTALWQICCTLANGDRAVAKEYFEVFCGGSIARIDDFKTLYLSRNGKTETLKGGRDKGHRREMELTVEAMKQGKDAPIPFEELIEVTEATFAIEEAIRTQKMVSIEVETDTRSYRWNFLETPEAGRVLDRSERARSAVLGARLIVFGAALHRASDGAGKSGHRSHRWGGSR